MDYIRSIEYYQRCLWIREASLPPDDSSIIDTLTILCGLQRTGGQFELALANELKCFLIREKILPPDHQDIGKSLCNIGDCYNYMNKLSLALDYYKRALDIYKQCLPHWDDERWNLEWIIEQLTEEIEENQVEELEYVIAKNESMIHRFVLLLPTNHCVVF
jgi:tetratricopeptide (TPR) repeat protein